VILIPSIITKGPFLSRPVRPLSVSPGRMTLHNFKINTRSIKTKINLQGFRHSHSLHVAFQLQMTLNELYSSTNTMQVLLFDEDLQRPELKTMFGSPAYKKALNDICGTEYPHSQRVQVSLRLTLPGQCLADHYDLPWFSSM
jgi:hypothetical protein